MEKKKIVRMPLHEHCNLGQKSIFEAELLATFT